MSSICRYPAVYQFSCFCTVFISDDLIKFKACTRQFVGAFNCLLAKCYFKSLVFHANFLNFRCFFYCEFNIFSVGITVRSIFFMKSILTRSKFVYLMWLFARCPLINDIAFRISEFKFCTRNFLITCNIGLRNLNLSVIINHLDVICSFTINSNLTICIYCKCNICCYKITARSCFFMESINTFSKAYSMRFTGRSPFINGITVLIQYL